MARSNTEGIDELMLSMQQVAELPDEVADDMLQAGAKIVAQAQKNRYRTQLFDTGTLANSIKVSRMKTKRDGSRFLAVYPLGTHSTYTHKGKTIKVRNAEVAFVHEYGAPKRGIAAKGIMRAANEESAPSAVAAEAAVYDAWLTKNNL